MKFSIGHRLFAAVLLAILLVALSAIVLMRQNVMNSFGDYAVGIELDRLDELSGAMAVQYRAQGGWNFIQGDDAQRSSWIAAELGRLQRQRLAVVPAAPPMPPAAPAAPVPPAPPEAPSPVSGAAHLPPLPAPVMPAPPAPPTEAELPEPPPIPDLPEAMPVDGLSLPERVTLLDAGGDYLAGRPLQGAANVRRAITIDGKTVGYLAVAKAARPSDAMAETFVQRVADSIPVIVLASLGLSALIAMLLAAHFRTPILRLANGARALAEGKYETRLPATRSDELGALADSFNQLAARLDASESSRRQWVADTSHELRTPLSVLRAQLEAMEDGVRPPSAETTAAMLRQVLTLNKLIDDLYTLARADVGELALQRQTLDVFQLAAGQAASFHERFAAAGLVLTVVAPGHACPVSGDADRLRQVLANLFENCIRYCPAGAGMTLSAIEGPDDIAIVVDDSGPGVPAAAMARLGERFYRVEGSRSRAHGGAGLGLALCQRIAVAHGGSLMFARSPQGGLQARLHLPKERP